MAQTLKEATTALCQLAVALDTFAAAPNTPQFKDALDKLSQKWEVVRDLANKSTTLSIGDFFKSIGEGVIEAQKKLDQASEEYVRNALRLNGGAKKSDDDADAKNDAMPPVATMFRIPRITAEMKCSFETDSEKKFNVIFYSERNDVRELHQQTVNLEVVSVPVSPDYINYLKSHPQTKSAESEAPSSNTGPKIFSSESEPTQTPAQHPNQPLVFSAEDGSEDAPSSIPWQRFTVDEAGRKEARELIEKLDLREFGRRRSLVKTLLLPAFAQAIVMSDGHNARFILLATSDKKPRLAIWQLVLLPASLRLIYDMPQTGKGKTEFFRMHRFLAELGQTQKRSDATKS